MHSAWGWFKTRRGSCIVAVACTLVLLGWLFYPGYLVEFYHKGQGVVQTTADGVQTAARETQGFLLTHPYFEVRDIKVIGAEKLKGPDIVVRSGLGPNTGIWDVVPTELEERVRKHPWVKGVWIRRELPARLVITIEEWKPSGIVALDKFYYVADNGVIFKPLGEDDSMDFPFITGLLSAKLPLHDPTTREKLAEVLSFGHTVERTTLGLSEIRFEPGGGIVLYPIAYAVPFHVGWGDWDAKLDRLQWFVQKFSGQAARFEAVDLSFKGQVVTRPRGRV